MTGILKVDQIQNNTGTAAVTIDGNGRVGRPKYQHGNGVLVMLMVLRMVELLMIHCNGMIECLIQMALEEI